MTPAQELQKEIKDLINNFYQKTGVHVECIQMKYFIDKNLNKPFYVNVLTEINIEYV